jgi:probable rRNA maturation factor
MSAISFHFEGIETFEIDESAVNQWLKHVVSQEQPATCIEELNYIFCTDEYLLVINQQYLSHDYYTDVITFDNSDSNNEIVGDIFISIERIKENGVIHKVTFQKELYRVMVHGLLHLLGYQDKNPKDKEVMSNKEDSYLSLLKEFNVPRGTS